MIYEKQNLQVSTSKKNRKTNEPGKDLLGEFLLFVLWKVPPKLQFPIGIWLQKVWRIIPSFTLIEKKVDHAANAKNTLENVIQPIQCDLESL